MSTTNKIVAGLLILAIAAGLLLNRQRITRLLQVNSLFAEDKIVHNFSNMKDILPATRLPRSGPVHQWPVSIAPLNQTFVLHDKQVLVADMLKELKTTALIVVKDGTIVFEEYYQGTGPEDLRISWSMSKSFVSALTGIALENGQITSLDDPVTKYVPDLKKSAYNNVKLRDVMNMASGVKFDEDYLDFYSDINKMGRVLALGGSLDEFAASISETAYKPGTARQYVSIDTHVISMVLRSATNESLQDYFVKNLWSRIGASADAWYSTDSDGNAFALGGLNMRTRDYALFGELMRNKGRTADGLQIIPEKWVEVSTSKSAPDDIYGDPFDYGYQWWLPKDSDQEFFAVGVYGQYIYVNPRAGIVIAKNAAQRSFLEVDDFGMDYKSKNIAMFRSIAEHYSDWRLKPQTDTADAVPE